MSVHRRHVWTLDDAALSGNVSVMSAGGGLPRRISLAKPHSDAILADTPTVFYRLNEPSGATLYDQGAHAWHLPINVTPTFGGAGVEDLSITPTAGAYLAKLAARHTELEPAANGSFSIEMWWYGSNQGYSGVAFGLWPGWHVYCDGYYGFTFRFGQDSSQVTVYPNNGTTPSAAGVLYPGFGSPARWHQFVATYNNGAVLLYVDGSLAKSSSGATPTFTYATGSLLGVSAPNSINSFRYMRPMNNYAFWNGVVLTEAQIVNHYKGVVPTSRARWTRVFPAAATVRLVNMPGQNHRILAASDDRAVKTYLSVNGGVDRTEALAGEDPAFAIQAGATLTMDAEMVMPTTVGGEVGYPSAPTHLRPYIADSIGGGPALIYEEADPVVNVAAVTSERGHIDVQLSSPVGSVPTPTSAAPPAVQITGITQPAADTIRLENTTSAASPTYGAQLTTVLDSRKRFAVKVLGAEMAKHVYKGDAKLYRLTVTTVAGDPVDLTSAKVVCTIRRRTGETAALVLRNTAAGGNDGQIEIIDAANGVLDVKLSSANSNTLNPDSYGIDVVAELNTGEEYTFWRDTIRVEVRISDPIP